MKEVVELDQKLNVVILDFDDEKKRIALGLKQLTPHPWDALDTDLKVGDKVNVERSMMMNGRLDGHIVQGHVDQTATCVDIKDADGSWYFTFKYAFDKEMAKRGYITVDKGSVTVNGVSLTVCNPTDDTFQVAIIPYTYEHTNFHTFVIGSIVNIEFDIIGKYISRMIV